MFKSNSGNGDRQPEPPLEAAEEPDRPPVFSFDESALATVDSTSPAAAPAVPDTGGGGAGDHHLPTTPRLVCQPESPPDTEENVRQQAGDVFRSFVFERFARDRREGQIDPATPDSPELARERPPPLSQEARIGRQLAEIGDEIQRRYRPQFDDMIKSLDSQLTDSDASFDVFRRVAVRLFRDGTVSWGRIVALFFFGYRLAVEKICHGVSGFLGQIASWICRFIAAERIAGWIAQHGGWRSVRYITNAALGVGNSSNGDDSIQLDWRSLAFIGFIAAMCFAAFRFSRQSGQQ